MTKPTLIIDKASYSAAALYSSEQQFCPSCLKNKPAASFRNLSLNSINPSSINIYYTQDNGEANIRYSNGGNLCLNSQTPAFNLDFSGKNMQICLDCTNITKEMNKDLEIIDNS